MNFALLASSPDVLPLVRAIVAHPQCRLTFAVSSGNLTSELLQLAPAVRIVENWDELLRTEDRPAVIVAGRRPETLEGARRAAEAGHPLLVFPCSAGDPSFAYELSLIRDANSVVLFPAFPGRFVPAIEQARNALQNGSLGQLVCMQIERTIAGTADGRALLQPAEIDSWLLPDIDLVRWLGGNYDRVTALHTGASKDGVLQATMTLAGAGLPDVTWIARRGKVERWSCVIAGEREELRLESSGPPQDIRLAAETAPLADPSDGASVAWRRMLDGFLAAVAGEAVEPAWIDLTRVLDTIDAAHRSVARRRTIDLYFETTSERSMFKTQMTAIGCGLLSLTLLLVVAIQVVTALVDIPPAQLGTVRLIAHSLVVGPLLIYLALQLLLPVTRPAVGSEPPERQPSRG